MKRVPVSAALVVSAVLATLLAPGAAAQTMVVQNDSVSDFDQVGIQAGFVADEKGAAWLTSPCDGTITAIRIFWASFTGGASDTIGQSVEIFEAGTFPTPGPRLVELLGPVMADGFLNEFTLPMPQPVSENQTFVVSFQFLDDPPLLGPSLTNDTDGCQAGRNGILAFPPGAWFSSCDLGVGGDFVIRAVVDCGVVDPTVFIDGFETGDTTLWSAVVGL